MKDTKLEPNLYLRTKDDGTSYYILRVTIKGKQIVRSLGNEDSVSLRDARVAMQRLLTELRDCKAITVKRRAPTFAEILPSALEDIALLKQWRNPKSAHQWKQSLTDYAVPVIGDIPVTEITRDDILRAIKPIWFTKPDTASRTLMRIEAVFNWAITRNYAQAPNPATWRGNLSLFLPAKSKVTRGKHHEAPTFEELQKVVRYCLDRPGLTNAAILFGIATAGRVSEFIGMHRNELTGDTWVMPAERRKDGKPYPHRVPLSSLAKEAIKMMGKETVLFNTAKDCPRLKLQKITGRAVTMHGCRSTFRDWCASNGIPDILAEKSLSHQWGTEVTEAYQREDLLEQRRPVMQAWADALSKANE